MEKSHNINHSDLELPIWFMLRPTSRPAVSSGTMTGLEVTRPDARLLIVVTTSQLPRRDRSLAHSGRSSWGPKPGGIWGSSNFSPKCVSPASSLRAHSFISPVFTEHLFCAMQVLS